MGRFPSRLGALGLVLAGCTDPTHQASAAATPGDAAAEADVVSETRDATRDARAEAARPDAGGCRNGDASPAWPLPITTKPTTVIAIEPYAFHLALGGGRVFWTGGLPPNALSAGPGSIFSASAGAEAGSPVRIFAGERPIVAFAADARNVYWTDQSGNPGVGRILVMPLEGGTPTVLLERETTFRALAVDATHVYATYSDSDWGALIRLPIEGGAVEKLAPDMPHTVGHEGTPNALAVNSRFVHYVSQRELIYGDGTNRVYSDNGIFRRPLAGGSRERVGIDPAVGEPPPYPVEPCTTLALQGDSLCASRDSHLMCRTADNQALHTVATMFTCTPLAVADGYVYFRTFAKLPLPIDLDSCDIDFRRIAVTGGDVETIATLTNGAHGFAVEGSDVYWIANDRVLKTALK